MPVGIRQRRPTKTLVLPFYLARCELSGDKMLPHFGAVNMVPNHHRTAHPIGETAREVDLLSHDSALVQLQTDEYTTNPKSSSVHILAQGYGREILGRALGHFL